MRTRISRFWLVVGLLVAAVAVAVVSFALGAGGEFAGSDGQGEAHVAEMDPGYEPWFSPVFEPGSGEIESGLFALQAAIGGVVVGYALGVLRTRHRQRRSDEARTGPGE